MYERMLCRVPGRHKPKIIQLLQFLLFSSLVWPLSPEDVIDAICVNPESDPPFRPEYRIYHFNDVLSLCPGLFEVQTGVLDTTIYFSHASVRNYLVTLPRGHELE